MQTISVCIPAIEAHVPYIDRCLASIHEQIRLPDEVIIIISNITDIDSVKETVKQIIAKYADKLDIYASFTMERQYAGQNRNIAMNYSSSDIISFIDVDDVMYPHRLYTIEKIFEKNPDCIGVLHHFTENLVSDPVWNFDINKVKKYMYSENIHYGHPSFRCELFNEFKYSNEPRTQDFQFIESILPKYIGNLYVYEQPLSCYYSNDSSHYNETISALNNLKM